MYPSRLARSPRPTSSISTVWRSARTSMRCDRRRVAARRAQRLGGAGSVEHHAVDERHHVERRTVDRLVGAQAQRHWDRHIRRADGADDAMLTSHVVCRRQDVTERRAAQDEAPIVGVVHAERQVRPAARDLLEPERCHRPVDVLDEPGADRIDVEASRRWDGCALAQPGRPTPTTLPQLTDEIFTTSPLFGAWTS